MAPSNMSGKVRKKTTTREARYKKTKAAELAARTKRASDVRGLPQSDAATVWKGKQKAREEEEEDPHPFRYKSFNDRLATVHINVATSLGRTGTGALAGLDGHGLAPTSGTGASISRAIGQASYGEAEGDSDDEDDDELQSASLHAKTSFGVALLTWRELNLSLPFTSMAQRMQPLSLSLPLLLHNQVTITTLLSDALHATHPDSYLAYEPALDLIPRLAADLGSAFLASYATLMKAVLRVTTISKLATDGQEYAAATIVERAFESLAAVLRCMAPFVLREVPSDEGVSTGVDGEQRPDWLVTTWELMRPYLGDVPTHARRFASEALAHLLRRAKADQTTRIAGVMMTDVQRALQAHQTASTATTHGTATFASGVAGVWAEATKSVDSRLHSMATTQLDAILTAHDAEDNVDACEARIVVGSFMLTALCHHATSSELLPVFEWVADLLDARLSADVNTPLGLWRLREACEWMSTLVGTRKGKRLDDAAKGTLFALLHRAAKIIHKFEGDDVGAHTAMIQLIVLSMRTARIQDLVGPILKMLDALAGEHEVALSPSYSAVVICLAESEFTAFRQVVLPSVMRVTSSALEAGGTASDDAIKLLWTLHGHGDLLTANTPTPAATRWQAVLARAINERIDALATGEAPATGLAGLSLAGVLESSQVAHAIVEKICKAGNANGPAVFCLCLHALTSLGNRHGKAIFVKAVESFEASGTALEALLHANAGHRLFVVRFAAFADSAKERGVQVQFADFAAVIDSLAESATSADQELRLAAARLLSLAEQRAPGTAQLRLFAKLADVEQCGVQVDLLRERNVHVRSLARELLRVKVATPAGDLPEWFTGAVGLFVRSIVSTMKLNLRPLWDESRKALVDLSAQFGGEVWKYAFQELTSAASSPERSAGAKEGPLRDALENILQSESVEKTFRDPVLAEARLAVRRACQQDDGDAVLRQLQRDQATQGRLDVVNYHVQILSLFSAIAPLVERHNAALMQHFFTTIVDRHDEDIDEDVGDEDDDDTDGDADGDQEAAVRQPAARPAATLSRNERREQLCAYLETFAQFSNPKALYRSADLHAFLYRLCTQGDNKVQRLVLDVILQWKDPAHVANAAIIRKLLSANEFREQLTSLVLADTAEGSIQPGHRATLLPLLLRMMYGIIISKQSRKSGQANRKSSILTALADLPADELRSFVDVMLEPFADVCSTMDEQTGVFAYSPHAPAASRRVQNGFIALLEDVVKHLGLRIIPLWSPLLQTTLNITHHAALAASRGHGTATQVERALRQSGLRRINDFFRIPTTAFDWQPFLRPLFDALLSPRLPLLRVESTQSPSVVLDIVHTWSDKPSTVFLLVDVDASLLTHVMACLDAPGVKPSVIGRILDMVESVVAFDDEGLQHVRQRIIRPHITALVGGYEALVRRCESVSGPEAKALGRDELFGRILAVLARLAAHVEDIHDVTLLLTSLAPLLRKSNYIVSERSKADVLSVFDQLMPAWLASGPDATALEQVYETFCSLFSRIRARSTRATLCRAFVKFVDHDAALQRVSQWVDGLNAYDVKRMQEYDFDRRLAAFDALNGEDNEGIEVRASLTARQWSPLLNNFVYYMHDPDELALRTSAGTALRKYIDTLAVHQREQTAQAESLESLFTHVIFAGLRRGLRSKSDLVKREAIATIGHAVAHLPGIAYLAEMQALLVDGDDEANFFNNILHIQVHRRVRALARLGQEVQRGTCSSRTIADVHLPLVEQFFLLDNNTDGNLLQQAVECLGQLAGQLAWGPYNVLLWKYLAFKRDKDQEVVKVPEKVSVRAAMSILDNFHFDMNEEISGGDDDDDDVPDAEDNDTQQQREARRNVLDTVRHRLLPKLMACLDLKDDMDDVVRLPIAVGIARVLLRLPAQHRRTDIVRLLNTMAHVFRSKAQDTRNLARTTLAKVAVTLGAVYFAPLVVELRKVLNRGPQLAVLAFTVHNVLVHCIESGTLSMLQEGTSDVVEVVIEDIFGRTSEDRHSVEHRTTYKEVKATKSMDTYEHVSRIVAPNNVRLLLLPLKELMRQTEAVQATRSFDECLRRIAAGLQHNAHLSHDDYLVLCHSLLSQNTTMLQAAQKGKAGKSKSERRTSAVLAKRQDVEQGAKRDHYAHNAHRFVAFGLDLLSTALRRGKFDFNDANDVAKMEPLVDVVGNSLYAQQTSIVVQALRCMGLLIPCKLDSVRPALPTITKQTLKLIEGEGNGRSDILMASLKLLTILVSKGGGDDQLLTERQMTMLCRLVDVHVEEELEMQGTLFGLVRALIARKHAVPELYDLMDKVARMLVLQQSDGVRTTCRATYLDFLLNVPQAKKRFDNQVDFLVKNAAYEFESGRLSVLDMLRLMLDRMSDDVMRAYLDALFMAMVLRLTNDESAPCRRRAGELLRRVLDVCTPEEFEKYVQLTQTWARSPLTDAKGRNLVGVAAMVFGIMLDVGDGKRGGDWQSGMLTQFVQVCATCADRLEEQEVDDDGDDDMDITADEMLSDWQVPYQSLQLIVRLFQQREAVFPGTDTATAMAHFDGAFVVARRLLLYPHAWVRKAASRFFGARFAALPVDAAALLDVQDTVDLCKKFALVLRSPQIDEPLATQVVKNLVYVGKCFATVDVQSPAKSARVASKRTGDDDDDDVEEDDEYEDVLWRKQPLRWLFNKLSHQLRRSGAERAHLSQGAFLASSAILKWMAATMGGLESVAMCERYLVHVVAPLQRIMESEVQVGNGNGDVAGAERRTSLQALATEVQEMLQAKVGTQSYAATYARVRRKVNDKRQQRRTLTIQRAIENPEQATARKVQRNQRKHESRKRKTNEFAKNKDRVRPAKRQR